MKLLRPLLDQKKEDLQFLSKFVFNFYVEDPSNYDEKYKRIQIRNLMKKLKSDGLDKKKFNNTIQNLKNSNKTIDFYVNNNLKKILLFPQKRKTNIEQ